jgi:hypothetical protein
VVIGNYGIDSMLYINAEGYDLSVNHFTFVRFFIHLKQLDAASIALRLPTAEVKDNFSLPYQVDSNRVKTSPFKIGSVMLMLSDSTFWTTDSLRVGEMQMTAMNDSAHTLQYPYRFLSGTFSFTAKKIGSQNSGDTIHIQNGILKNVPVDY